MVILEFGDRTNIKRIKIKAERIIDIQGEDVRKYSFHVFNVITDLLRQQINIRGCPRVIPIENGVQEDSAFQVKLLAYWDLDRRNMVLSRP